MKGPDKTREPLLKEIIGLRQKVNEQGDNKEKRENLEQDLKKYEFIANSSQELMTLINRQYVYEAANKSYCRAINKKRDEIIGKTVAEIWGEERFDNFIKGYLEQCFAGNSLYYEDWFPFWGQELRCYEVHYYPYVNIHNEVTHAVVVSHDITEHQNIKEALKKSHDELEKIVEERTRDLAKVNQELRCEIKEHQETEQALRHSEAKYRDLVENANSIIMRMDQQGQITFFNEFAQSFFGYQEEEILGSNIVGTIVPPTDSFGVDLAAMMHDLATHPERYTNNENENIKQNGERVWISWTNKALRDEQGHFREILCIGNDITEQKRITDKLSNLETLQEILEGTINALASALEKRDPYTAGHQRRVAKLACAIAREMGLPEQKITVIRLAALVHDVGKIYVPAEFLTKPSALSGLERGMIQTHSEAGFEILQEVKFPWPIAQIVLQHHERLNGSGYPQGLGENDILQEAKIIAVADVVEAISCHRPYREAKGIGIALDEISQHKGTFFDPEAVDACLRLFNEKGYQIKEI
jgi:PAS domain S-box-containing protein/putative nucleotidyltransferase with HDIG domain